jgi:hypothetical protein
MNKFLEFQKRVSPIIKDATNPFFKSKYADINTLLATIRPVLNELGIVIIQPLMVMDGKNVLCTHIFDGENSKNDTIQTSNLMAESSIIIPDNLDPQKIGSAITYYRRYSLQALLLLEAEDDDAEGTKGNGHKPEVKPKDRNYTEEANNCKTIDELKSWYKELPPALQTTFKKLVTNRKEELLALQLPSVNDKPDIIKQAIINLTTKTFKRDIKLVEDLVDKAKDGKPEYIAMVNAKLTELKIKDYQFSVLPF